MKPDRKETEKFEDQSKNSNMSGMNIMMGMMILCCAIPLIIFAVAGGGLGFWFGRSNPQPVNQINNPPQSIKK